MQKVFFRFVFLLWLTLLLSFSFITPTYALDVTLAWDANTELDVAGYKLYYKAESSGPPYNGTGAAEGDSPITLTIDNPGDPYNLDDPDNPEFTLAGLDDGEVYFFAVTAYNADDLQSDYSNEVSTSAEETIPITPSLKGSEPGGGCFISSLASH